MNNIIKIHLNLYILFIILLNGILISNLSAQQPHIRIFYDFNGNRIQRAYIPLRLAETNVIDTSQFRSLNITVYPNPVKDQLNIQIPDQADINSQIVGVISNSEGKKLLTQHLNKGLNSLDLSNYPPGIYFLKIYIDKEIARYKIIKV